MELVVVVIIAILVLWVVLPVFVTILPYLLIALGLSILYAYFKYRKAYKQAEKEVHEETQYKEENPDIIDVDYKVVDDENNEENQ